VLARADNIDIAVDGSADVTGVGIEEVPVREVILEEGTGGLFSAKLPPAAMRDAIARHESRRGLTHPCAAELSHCAAELGVSHGDGGECLLSHFGYLSSTCRTFVAKHLAHSRPASDLPSSSSPSGNGDLLPSATQKTTADELGVTQAVDSSSLVGKDVLQALGTHPAEARHRPPHAQPAYSTHSTHSAVALPVALPAAFPFLFFYGGIIGCLLLAAFRRAARPPAVKFVPVLPPLLATNIAVRATAGADGGAMPSAKPSTTPSTTPSTKLRPVV